MDDEWELFQKSMKEETVVSTRTRPETGFMFSAEKKRRRIWNFIFGWKTKRKQQEGQHPLTGLRAANFRRDFNWWLLGKPVFDCMFAVVKFFSISLMAAALCATHVLTMGVGPFAFRYQGNGATPCQYIDTTPKAIDCATTLPLTVFI